MEGFTIPSRRFSNIDLIPNPGITESKSAVHGGFALPEPGEKMTLDLTLGTDADLDGLPDAWERWQAPEGADDDSELDYFSPDGDADKDGVTDYQEYLRGMDAAAADRSAFGINSVRYHPDGVLELGIKTVRHRAYMIEWSPDGKKWCPIPVSVGEKESAPRKAHAATHSTETSVFAPTEDRKGLYRLLVR